MPKKQTIERVRRDKREGKSASTQAGEFVREEIETIRKGEHGARSTKQAIAIGLSKARRAGVKLPVPKKGSVPEETRRKAMQDLEKGESEPNAKPSRKRSQAALKALKREGRAAASNKHSHDMPAPRHESAARRSAPRPQERLREPAESSGALELIEGQRRNLVHTFRALHRRAAPASRVSCSYGFRRKAFPAHRVVEALVARVGDRRLAQPPLQRTRAIRPAGLR